MEQFGVIKFEPFPVYLSSTRRIIIPPGWTLEEPAVLRIRLRSTRGGNMARWYAGEKARQAMNNAMYEPVIRAIVKDFRWFPPQTRDCPCPLHDPPRIEEDEVYQAGTGTINWYARVIKPLPDPFRELITEVAKLYQSVYYVGNQGNLKIYRAYFSWINIDVDSLPEAGSGFRRLYNHFVYPCRKWLWRVVDNIAIAIVVTAGERLYITSPHHPESGIELGDEETARQIIILTHPVPTRYGGD